MIRHTALAALLFAGILGAQTFDAASVKPSGKDERYKIQMSPGAVVRQNVNLSSIVRWAYGIQAFQLRGPDWLQVECYDVIAKSAGPATESEMRVMMQHLLAERFHIAAHWETQVMKVDVLRAPPEAAKNFAPSDATWFQDAPGFNGKFTGYQFSDIAEFCSMAGALVVDGSGMPGRFDFNLNWAKYRRPMSDEERRQLGPQGLMMEVYGSFRDAVTKELGLRFTPEPYPVRTLVIDSIDKTPTAN